MQFAMITTLLAGVCAWGRSAAKRKREQQRVDRDRLTDQSSEARTKPADAVDWFQLLDAHYDRQRSSQRDGRNSVLLLMTFAEGVAATLVATALQVNESPGWVMGSCLTLGLGVLWILVVLLLDRITIADLDSILTSATALGWSREKVTHELRIANYVSTKENDRVIRLEKMAVFVQFGIATAAGTMAIVSITG